MLRPDPYYFNSDQHNCFVVFTPLKFESLLFCLLRQPGHWTAAAARSLGTNYTV